MEKFINDLNGWVWSTPLIALCLGAGLYFSLRTRFVQVRQLKEMVRLLMTDNRSEAGVSSFQALAMSLSGRVGIGNIAGVATAIAYGGPGAVFWMWVVAFLGASTAYIESTLGQIYKEKDSEGRYRGGPAYFIEKATGQKWYAWLFALCTVVACGLLLPGVQANGIAEGMRNAWDIPPQMTATVLVVLLGFIIFGGVKRIASVAEIVVPFMALAYILVAMVIMLLNADKLPAMWLLIIKSAFASEAAFGGMIGLAIEWGVKRGIYSNEAGQGTGPHAAAAAEVSHPAKQGLVQAFSVYVDTLLVCSATAFMILSTGAYNVIQRTKDATGEMVENVLVQNLPSVKVGPGFAQQAVESVLPGYGGGFVALALFFFAFTTVMAYYYMAETNVTFITRGQRSGPLVFALRLLLLAAVTFGAVRTADMAWTMGDIGVGLMAWLNIIAILLIQRPALAALRDYEKQKSAGIKEPEFDPDALGIKNAEFWRKRKEERGAD